MLLGPRKNLVGKSFGNLTVLDLSDQINQRYYWKCICHCGKEKDIDGYRLRSGKITNCGCGRNLVGKKFHDLTVIELDLNNPNRGNHWICKCICNNSCIATTGELNRGNKKHCGSIECRRRHSSSWKGYKNISGSLFSLIKTNAISRNLTFSITIEEIWNLYEEQNRTCALSGVPIHFAKTKFEKTTASLDRIDNTKGYTSSNIQWVHQQINQMKWDATQSEFVVWCTLVSNHQRK